MKQTMVFATIFSSALAISAAAQTGSAGSQPPGQEKSTQPQEVTVTGCLQSAASSSSAAAATGTSGAASSASRGAHFLITNAKMAGGSAAGTSGTAAPGAAGESASQFKLEGGNQSDLQKFVNSQVEVRGKLDRGRSSSPSASAPAGGAPGAQKSDDAPTLRVSSIRQVASSCSGI